MSTNLIVFDGFLTVDRRELHVQHIAAPHERPTMVFLHEGLGSVLLWRDFPQRVAAACGVGALVYSRYGNGESAILTEARAVRYMHDEALMVLPELLRMLAIERPVLYGHSDGASIALIYAAAYPKDVRALILEAPHLFVEDLSLASISSIRKRYEGSALRERMKPHHRDADRTFYGWNDIWLDPAFRAWNIEGEVRRVQVPALAIQGSDDEYGTLAQLESLADNARGPVDRLILSGCGHAPHRDRGSFVEETIRPWLEDIARS